MYLALCFALRCGFSLLSLSSRNLLYSRWINAIQQHVAQELTYTQDRSWVTADEDPVPAPTFKTRDLIWLVAKNLATHRPSPKLDHCKQDLFHVSRQISPHADKLALPVSMKVHPVFHISLMELPVSDPLPAQINPLPPPGIVEDKEENYVEEILDSHMFRCHVQYLVKWVGCNQSTWEPPANLQELAALEDFHRRYLYKARTNSINGTTP